MAKGFYSLGLVGYELWTDPNDCDRMMVLYVGTQREQVARSYKVQMTPKGRPYVRPHGRRIYLDLVLRTDI